MKKIFSLIMILFIISGLCACQGNKKGTGSENKNMKIHELSLKTVLSRDYDCDKIVDISYTTDKINKSKYEITGKVTFETKQKKTLTKNYEATVTYDSEDGYGCAINSIKIY